MVVHAEFVLARDSAVFLHLFHVKAYPHLVSGVSEGGVGEEAAAENMVPSQCSKGIAPVYVHVVGIRVGVFFVVQDFRAGVIVVEKEDVPAMIGVEVEPVVVGKAPGQFSVEVVEIVVRVQVPRLQQRGEEYRVHPPCADRICQFVLDYRAFEMQPVADGPYADGAVRFLHVAVVGADVDY